MIVIWENLLGIFCWEYYSQLKPEHINLRVEDLTYKSRRLSVDLVLNRFNLRGVKKKYVDIPIRF